MLADVNRDDRLDIVTADDVSGSASVLLGNGDGTFREKAGYGAMARTPRHLAIGDLDRDGWPDLVMAHPSSGLVSVLLARREDATPVLLASFSADRVAGGVALRWRFTEPGRVTSSRLEWSEHAAGPWREVAAERAEREGAIVAVDREADPLRDRWYRLLVTLANGPEALFGPLFVPGPAASLSPSIAVTPNPSAGPVQLEYALVAEGRVRLGILDLQGREVARPVDGWSSAGRNRVEWSGAGARGPLPCGVYLARLETPAGVVTRRFVRAR